MNAGLRVFQDIWDRVFIGEAEFRKMKLLQRYHGGTH